LTRRRGSRPAAESPAHAAQRRGHAAAGRAERPKRRGPRIARAWNRRLARAIHSHPIVAAAALAALGLLCSALTFMPAPHTGGDNAAYITLGRSLLERRAYLELWDPATPPHTQYPPVFPLILAIAMAIGLQPWVPLKAIVMLLGAGAVAFSFLWIRRRGRPLLALGVAFLLAISPGILTETHWILSDVPFWCFTVAALWAFERLPPGLHRRFAFAVAATVLAYFTRSAGLPLAFAAFGWLAFRRRWRQLAVLAAVLGPLAFLWWLRARTQGGVDYVSQFLFVNPYSPELGRIGLTDLPARIGDNGEKYLRDHLPILLTGRNTAWMLWASIAVVLTAALGWAWRLRRPAVPELFTPMYIGLLLVWPAVWSGERFLLPLIPLLLFYAGWFVVKAGRWAHPRAGPIAAAAILAAAVLAALPTLSLQVRVGSQCTLAWRLGDRYPCLPPEWTDFFGVAEWTRLALPDTAVVISRKPRLFYVLSGHPGRIYPFSERSGAFFAAADSARARHLVFDFLDRPTQAYVRPVLLARPAAFCILFSSPLAGTAVFGIRPDAAALPDAPTTDTSPSFPLCAVEYWRSAEVRDDLLRGVGR
jgi:hypothetical protein